jgi:hypothetical protein
MVDCRIIDPIPHAGRELNKRGDDDTEIGWDVKPFWQLLAREAS